MYINLSPEALGLKVTFEETIRLAKSHGFGGIYLPLKEVIALSRPERFLSCSKLVVTVVTLPSGQVIMN